MRRLRQIVDQRISSWTGGTADLKLLAFTLAILAGAFACYAWSFGSLPRLIRSLDNTNVLFLDFTNHYYPAGHEVWASGKPASRYYYSAFFAICLGTFARFSIAPAVWLWGICQGIAFVLLMVLPAGDLLRRSRWYYYLWVVLLASSMPILHNFIWGQISTPIVLCLIGTLYMQRRGRTRSAAALLALASAVKFYPAVFILYFVFKRQWRFVMTFLVTAVLLLAVVPVVVLGPAGAYGFTKTTQQSMKGLHDATMIDINSQYFPNAIARICGNHLRVQPGWQVLRWTGYGLFAANVLLLLGLVRMRVDDEASLAFVLLFLSLPLLVESSWPHYFVYMPFCQVITWMLVRRQERRWWGNLILVLLIAPSTILSSMLFFRWIGRWSVYSTDGYLLLADLLLMAAVYLHIGSMALQRRRTSRLSVARALDPAVLCQASPSTSTTVGATSD